MKTFFVRSFEKILNGYLQLDDESKRRLRALEGKIISLELLGVKVNFQLKILGGKVLLQDVVQSHDVLIKGSPLFLLHMALLKENRKKILAEDVTIEGDLELGQQIIDLFDELEIDWEEYLSRFVGDVPAHHLGKVVRRAKRFSRITREVLFQNVNEFVHEEADLFPPREALQDFFHEIDDVRMDADRLLQRVRRLEIEREE